MFQRVCGKCGTTLNKDNTGQLKWLQPDCNDCMNSKRNTCNHNFKEMKHPKGSSACILCGLIKCI